MPESKTIPTVLGIESAAQFWMEIVQPNFLRFQSDPTAREAFNLCSSLWHIIDWIEKDWRTNTEKLSLHELRTQFESSCPALSALHDITTVSKHGSLSKSRGNVIFSTAEIQGVNFYFSKLGPVSEHPAAYTVHFENGETLSLHDLIATAYTFWDSYFKPPALINK